jgi:GT2 family glycosyltransferase
LPAPAPVTAVIVAFGEPESVLRAVHGLLAQTRPPSQVVVIDNHPDEASAAAVEAAQLPAEVVRPGRNLGYARASDLAAERATQPWILFVNPDAEPAPDCVETLLEATAADVAAVGAQILLPGGEQVNAGDNPLHLTGLSWSGRYLEPREDGPARDVASVSGAGLMIRTATFNGIGGHCPAFFMYHDDVDLCWRARLAGWRVVFVPRARIEHDYVFEKGSRKWFEMEHNRIWTVLANYEARTLALLAPLLLAFELAIAVLALRDGWWPEKRRGWAAVVRERGELRRWRRHVQGLRACPDAVILARMTGRLDTPLVSAPGTGAAGAILDAYRRLLCRLA